MALRKGLTWRRATLGIALASALLAPDAGAQRSDLEKIIHRRVLQNGLEVIVVENHGVPLVTVEIDVKNGSFTQSPQTAGLAHMYEHMFFRASKRFPGSDEFVERAADMGAVFNGSTREENVNYYLTVTSDRVQEAMRLLSASFREPLFRQDELERERQVVLGEYDRNESNPFFALTQALDEKLYPGNAVRKNTIGDRTVIANTTPAQMRAIQQKYYVPNNSVLIVTGDVEPAAAFAAAEREYGSIPRGEDPFVKDPIPRIPALQGNDAIIHEAGVGAVTVFLQWQGPSVGLDPDATYAADVFSDVLNDPSSRLQQRLVDSGLWDGITVNYYTLNNTGPITISGQTSPQRLRQALAALYAEIPQFAKADYFDPEEIAATKAVRAVSSAFDRERSSGFAHTLGFWWSVASLEYYMGYVDNMAAQTVNDLTRYAGKYIVGKPRISGVLIAPDARRSLGLTTAELIGGGR